MSKEVILTGLRANGEFHLGNYLGAIKPMVELQKRHAGEYQVNMFVPDLHSFTTPIDHGSLYENTLNNLKYFVAAGLDIKEPDTFIYRQSYIPAHSELTWILDCFVGTGDLRRMTQYKDKIRPNESAVEAVFKTVMEKEYPHLHEDMREATEEEFETKYYPKLIKLYERINEAAAESEKERSSVGLFNYPVLMAADILLYGAKWVPVGEDQRQHVEFTRDLATRMNNKFGDMFVVPEDNSKQTEFSGRSEPVRIRSLRTPEKKMSKSIEDPAGTILLSDNPFDAEQKVMSATTDSENSIHWDWEKQPGVTNLLQILTLLGSQSKDEVISEWEGKSSYGQLKESVAEAVKDFLSGLQQKLTEVNHDELIDKLEADEAAMSSVANETLERVQQAVGLRPKP